MTGGAAAPLRDAPWLHEGPLARLLMALDSEGEEARVVGGAVRNSLFGQPPGDVDVATTALPDEVIRRARAQGMKAVPTGVEHGTVTVVAEGRPFEVTTLREDVETFGRKAKVAFGRDWKRDAERRDFTMNALSVSRDGRIHDYVGGLADIAARRVRFIGDAATRIAEDYLRILRFFRFHAIYGHGAPDADGLHASIVARSGLAQLSRERVRMELLKLLPAKDAGATLAVMADCGILVSVLGGVPYLASLDGMIGVEAALGIEADAVRRLGALGVWVAEDAERLWQKLRLSNEEHERLVSMADRWWRIGPGLDEKDARALLYRLGPERYRDRVMIAWARGREAAGQGNLGRLAGLPERWSAPAFPLRAADFLARGLEKGPALGDAMRAAEEAWIRAGFPLDAPALAAIADEARRRA